MNTACKCCGGACRPAGAVPFSKTCEDRDGVARFPPSAEAVAYLECGTCGFLFTTFADEWDGDRFRAEIYNGDYAIADPELGAGRAGRTAALLSGLFGAAGKAAALYDWGGGDGSLAAALRDIGFARVQSGDPFFADGFAPPPERATEIVTAVEVAEHLARPAELFAAAAAALRPDHGVLFLSTLLRPPGVGVDWWYCAPRNGHLSLHTGRSLTVLAFAHGFRFASLSDAFHLAWRGDPAFARHITAQFGDA